MSKVQVKKLTEQDISRWDRFAAECGDATFFHLAGWRTVIDRAFGHDTHYLFAEADGAIVGILPLVHVHSRLFANALVSTPFCVYGGIATHDTLARAALEEAACALARELRVQYLEMRNITPRRPDWLNKSLYVTFRREIFADPDRNLLAIPQKQRAMVRKGIKAGLEASLDAGVDRLYALYSESLRNLGTPVFGRRYLEIIREVFGSACEVVTVTHAGAPVASVLNFYFRDTILPYYGGGSSVARDLKANDFMYWEVMRRAAERGVRVFDFGRSKVGTGSYRFKKHWGFDETPLAYEYFLVRAHSMPNLSPTNPKYRLLVSAWQRMPLPLSRLLGPPLARHLG